MASSETAKKVHSLLSAAMDVRGLAIKFEQESLLVTATATERFANLLVSDALLWAGILVQEVEDGH